MLILDISKKYSYINFGMIILVQNMETEQKFYYLH